MAEAIAQIVLLILEPQKMEHHARHFLAVHMRRKSWMAHAPGVRRIHELSKMECNVDPIGVVPIKDFWLMELARTVNTMSNLIALAKDALRIKVPISSPTMEMAKKNMTRMNLTRVDGILVA